MRIVLMGYGKWACEALRALQGIGHTIVCVVCEPYECETRREEYYRKLLENGLYESLVDVAEGYNVNVLRVTDTRSDAFYRKMKEFQADLIVSCGWRRIVGDRVLESFTCINIHGALLPDYRGRMPVAWAILNGEARTGVTVHHMTRKVDEGAIICQESFSISETDTVADVLRNGMGIYPALLQKAILLISSNEMNPIPQDTCAGSYWPPLTENGGRIDWRQSTRDIYNLIRSQSSPYPGAYTYCGNRKLVINKASVPSEHHRVSPIWGIVFGRCIDGSVKVTTGDGYIVLNEMLEGESPITSALRMGCRFR